MDGFVNLIRRSQPINKRQTLKTRRSLRLIVWEAIMKKVMDQVRDSHIQMHYLR